MKLKNSWVLRFYLTRLRNILNTHITFPCFIFHNFVNRSPVENMVLAKQCKRCGLFMGKMKPGSIRGVK